MIAWIATLPWLHLAGWENPAWLLALPVALLPFWHPRPHLSIATLPARPSRRHAWLLPPVILYAAGLLALLLALAAPRLAPSRRLPPPQGHLVIVLDTSASMGTPAAGGETTGGARSRLDLANQALESLLAGLPPLRTALVRAASEPALALPLTQDTQLLQAGVMDSRVEPAERGASALGDGLALALRHLPAGVLPGAILLISDGRNNYGRLDLTTAAAAAAALQIPIFVLGAGSSGSIDGPEAGEDNLDVEGLQRLAQESGGGFARVEDALSLEPALRKRFLAQPEAALRTEMVRSKGGRPATARPLFLWLAAACITSGLVAGWGPLRSYP